MPVNREETKIREYLDAIVLRRHNTKISLVKQNTEGYSLQFLRCLREDELGDKDFHNRTPACKSTIIRGKLMHTGIGLSREAIENLRDMFNVLLEGEFELWSKLAETPEEDIEIKYHKIEINHDSKGESEGSGR